MTDVTAAADQELEGVVEHRRVGPGLVDDGREEGVVLRPQPSLARTHPVHVALDRVDLAVVAEQTEGLGPLPRRRRVRREALVQDAEGDGEPRIAEVGVEGGELVRGAERLVRDRPEGERGQVDAARALGPPARTVGAQLELAVVELRRRPEGELLDERRARASRGTEGARVDRHLAPAGGLDALGAAGGLDRVPAALSAEEGHGDPVRGVRDERDRNWEQDPRAVARPAVGGRCPAVPDAAEAFEQRIDDLARGAPPRIGDEADAAGVALGGGIVE